MQKTQINIESSNSIIGFQTKGGGHLEVWDRYLTLDNKPAYHLGNVCNTCAFFFERLEGANQSVSSAEIANNLNNGLQSLNIDLVETVSQIMPSGEYDILLLQSIPTLIQLGSNDDYFSNEQITLWGMDGFWGLSHYPKIEYYRGSSNKIDKDGQLFEFIVPMFPKNWLKQKDITEYISRLESGDKPTALAISVLDVKQPATWQDEPEVTKHWCLAHYLLDGHHKVFASSKTNTPITLLSFLARNQSIATSGEIEFMIEALGRKKSGQ